MQLVYLVKFYFPPKDVIVLEIQDDAPESVKEAFIELASKKHPYSFDPTQISFFVVGSSITIKKNYIGKVGGISAEYAIKAALKIGEKYFELNEVKKTDSPSTQG